MDATTIVEPYAQDRTEIERLVDLAQDRVINGKTIPKPVKNADTPSNPDILMLLEDFADVFQDHLSLGIRVTCETDHFIDLVEHAKPPAHRVYRLSPAEETELKRQLEAYLQVGQIEPARSPFGAGVYLARKKYGSLRLCSDYPNTEHYHTQGQVPTAAH